MKVSIIGAGNVGATTAFLLAQRDIAKEIVMIDRKESVMGKALDMMCSSPLEPFSTIIKGSIDYKDIKDSNIVVITAGLARQPGMSREDLLQKNKEIMESVCKEITINAPKAIIIVVTNPLDVMCYVALQTTNFNKSKVIGMAGVLDSARLRYFIADELNVKPEEVEGLVLGAHGDSMVSLPKQTTVNGKKVTELIKPERLAEIINRTANCGGEVVKYLKTGSAYYSPASSVVAMVKAIINDEKQLLPCSVYVEGEYDVEGIFLGLPTILGKNGIEEIKEIAIEEETKALLTQSAEITKKNLEGI